MNKKTKLFLSFFMSVAILTFFLFTQLSKANSIINAPNFNSAGKPVLKVYFFDIGQGDSILIKTPEGKDILVDGGPNGAVLERLAEVMPFWDHYIDIVILTHPHQDHIGGLFDILERYEVGQVLEPSLAKEPDNQTYFNKLAGFTEVEHLGIPRGSTSVFSPIAGDKITLGDGLVMDFFYPLTLNLEEDNLNDTSLVFKLSFNDIDFLFTGDATSEVEAKILGDNLQSEFLKIGHHGSRYSSSSQFLEKVDPDISIISVGAGNSFGHPTTDTLNRLNAVGSRILRTDKSGTIEVDVSEAGEWVINCSRNCN